MFPISIDQFCGKLNVVGEPTYPTANHFSLMSGVETQSLNSVTIWRMNLIGVCYVVVIHAYFMRSQILLTFSSHQLMHSVFCIAPDVKVSCKGLFLVQQHRKQQAWIKQGQELVFDPSQDCFGLMLHSKVYNYNSYSVFLK